jgi:hypothetical protein
MIETSPIGKHRPMPELLREKDTIAREVETKMRNIIIERNKQKQNPNQSLLDEMETELASLRERQEFNLREIRNS